MKIICSRDNLNDGIQIVYKAVSVKSPKPILSGILLETENDLLTLTATDMDISIRCSIPVTTIEAGKTVIPARYMAELVRKLPDVKIELAVEEGSSFLIINYGQSSLNISCFDYNEFPLFPSLEEQHSIIIDNKKLKQMIKQVAFAKALDETKAVFTGALMEVDQDTIKFVTSDTHRLALSISVLDQVSEQKYSVIIPGKTLNELNRLLGIESETVEIILDNSQIAFKINEINIISRLLEGQFPDYNMVIPQKCSSVIKVKTSDLLQATERAALLIRENSGSIRLTIEDCLLTINAANEAGKIHEEIPVEKKGDDIIIFFNVKYICDVLRIIDEEEIFIEFNGPLNAGVIKLCNNDNFLSLLLPIRAI